MADRTLTELAAEFEKSIAGLFVTTHNSVEEWETGQYFCIYGRPSKRMRAILDIEREVLFLGNVYADQQQRTVAFARRLIADAHGRLEPKVLFIMHADEMGNLKLKKWGREFGLTIIPIFISDTPIPKGRDLERLLSFEFFSQDPFDISGPVASDAQFYGRRTEAQELARKLELGQIRTIFGIRRIGKTSVMHRVLREMARSEALTTFVDCSLDSVFRLHASDLLTSIAFTIDEALQEGLSTVDLRPSQKISSLPEASKTLTEAIGSVNRPLLLAFDEVDYITPGSPAAGHWASEFVEFWRNIRASYQAALRNDRKFSILISGVSSKWFSVEAINGIENAALSFVPEEYLSPLPRGAAIAMIKNMGPMAGLIFGDDGSDYISASCSDMPFWIRKACSFIHSKLDTTKRPITMKKTQVVQLMDEFVRDEGGALSMVALQHLFRVYPETKQSALEVAFGHATSVSPAMTRILTKYGIVNSQIKISGQMLEAGLRLVRAQDLQPAEPPTDQAETETLVLQLGEWAEELQAISYRRNMVERRLRDAATNFLRFSSVANTSGRAGKQRILDCLSDRRKNELSGLVIDEIAAKLYWLEVAAIIKKEWTLFERIFGDLKKFEANVDLINDRPDAHAKKIDLADVALYRRALGWFEEKLERLG